MTPDEVDALLAELDRIAVHSRTTQAAAALIREQRTEINRLEDAHHKFLPVQRELLAQRDQNLERAERAEAALAQAQWELDKWYKLAGELEVEARQLDHRLDAAQARIAELERDAARIDWLWKHPRDATIRIGGDMKACVFYGVSCDPIWSVREAIDAAMEKGTT